MLGFVSGKRRIVGMDYDDEKIRVARNVVRNLERIRFVTADITRDEIPSGEIYILNDVLHYLPEEEQLMVLERCLEKMPENGKVILRDADAGLRKRTAFTKFTEFQSTRIFRFNKTRHRLTYLSGSRIEDFVRGKGFEIERFDHARLTSNITYVITR